MWPKSNGIFTDDIRNDITVSFQRSNGKMNSLSYTRHIICISCLQMGAKFWLLKHGSAIPFFHLSHKIMKFLLAALLYCFIHCQTKIFLKRIFFSHWQWCRCVRACVHVNIKLQNGCQTIEMFQNLAQKINQAWWQLCSGGEKDK